LAGASGASLFAMVANLTLSSAKFADRTEALAPIAKRAEAIRLELERQIAADTAAYESVATAYKLAKDTPDEKAKRSAAIQAALATAARVPLRTACLAAEMMGAAPILFAQGNPNCKTDVGVGVMSLRTAFHGARLNVEVNLKTLKDPTELAAIRAELTAAGEQLATNLAAAVEAATAAELTLD
jgi:formiminotetrahydrofolate cyclodeaminase